MKQAEWNGITWGNDLQQMANIKSIKLSQSIKTEKKENDKGSDKTIVKGLESEQLTISYDTGFVIGIDPRGEFEMLKKNAGKQDYFVLGGEQISKSDFTLDEINLANTVTDCEGQILTGEMTLTFSTDSKVSSKGGKATKKKKNKKGKKKKKKKSSITLNPTDIAKAKAL